MSKDKKNNTNSNKLIIPTFDALASINTGYGLDINENSISYTCDNIVFEAIGDIHFGAPQKLLITLRVYKKGTTNPSQIYRTSSADLFNDSKLKYLIKEIHERLKVESNKVKNGIYDFIERLDNYRTHGEIEEVQQIDVSSSVKKEAEKLLRSKNLLTDLEGYLSLAGMSSTRLGLQLFILSLSRQTSNPLHGVVNCSQSLGHALINEFVKVLPEEQLIERTSLSKNALSYAPNVNYWVNKTLVLHQLNTIKSKGDALMEYVMQGKSLRLVTQQNLVTGRYESEHKDVTETINLISHYDKDFHPIYTSPYTLCIPLKNTNAINESIYDNKVKQMAGLINESEQNHAVEVLQQLQRELKSYTIYNPVLEQVDLAPFFGHDYVAIGKYLRIVELLTILQQKSLKTYIEQGISKVEVSPKIMIEALELFSECFVREDEELYFRVASTFSQIKGFLQKNNPDGCKDKIFTSTAIRKDLKMSPNTLAKHLKKLLAYGKIKREGGTNRDGFTYTVISWEENSSNIKAYHKLLTELNSLS